MALPGLRDAGGECATALRGAYPGPPSMLSLLGQGQRWRTIASDLATAPSGPNPGDDLLAAMARHFSTWRSGI